MHTFKTGDAPHETAFHFNSDLSGDVSIRRSLGEIVSKELTIPAEHLLAFVAEFIRREKIARLEEASDMQILMGDAS
jgi:hypothetical protein